MKKLFTLAMCIIATICASAQQISLDDVVNLAYRPKAIYGVTPLPGGETYSQLSDNGKQIIRRSFKNGEALGVIFDVDNARGPKLTRIDGYIMSPDEKNILIETERKQIYRHSATSVYYIYNVHNRTLTPLSKNGPQECPKFSPDGYTIAFVRDNNIFIVKLLFNNAEVQVTKDGEFNKVINGKPDWVYEEEFSYNCAYDFSNDGQMLAWVRFDESQVSTFSFPWFQGSNPTKSQYRLYSGLYEYKYPKAGEQNSKVSVHSYDIKSRVIRNLDVPVEADGYIPRIQFTGEKDMLAVVTLNRHQDQMDVYMVNARSTVSQLILREKNDKYVNVKAYENLDFSGDQFVLLSDRDGYLHMYLYTKTGTLIRQLTKGNFDVTVFYGKDADGKHFYFASNEGSPLEQYIYKVDLSGKRTKLSSLKGYNTAIFSDGCTYFMNTYSSMTTPQVYSLCNA
ncbi:MAG: DPP IV N-terminal domain-containing protein, partial [Bacteroidaceae bacterium]|nr:DPP IV N-terminal domain-containing protein [Bacteroidaceae bacterium]